MEHQRRGHDVRFVDGGVCGDCGGQGGDCPRCGGAGYWSATPNTYRHWEAGSRRQESERGEAESRAEQEARWAEANRRREEEARRAKERADREREENEARRREENRRAAEEARRRAEEARRTAEEEARQQAAGTRRTQGDHGNATGSNVRCPTCEGVGRVPTRFHNILGLFVDPSPQEIGSAYRQKAMQYHPDRNKAPDASERMKEINEARRLLARSADIRAGQECPECNGRKTVWRSSAQAGAGSERGRRESGRRGQSGANERTAGRQTAGSGGSSSGAGGGTSRPQTQGGAPRH
ncbi:MAG: DnaJ domain-containing protein, partial [Chloroflexi bacterium]|nr:DnaJ domain-containing protein [Chloroflexota bacterium]